MMMRLLALLMMLPWLCTSCAALPAEERAFAVALLVEKDGNTWRVYGRIPTYQTGGGYLTMPGEGNSLSEAMADMEGAAPMHLHLSQLRLLVLDAALAAGGNLQEALYTLGKRADLRSQCAVAMTDVPMKNVAEALKPAAGARLSKAIDVLLDTRGEQGRILPINLGEILRMGERQSPVLIGLTLEEKAVSFAGGYALTEDWRIAQQLDRKEVALLALLMGKAKELQLSMGAGMAEVREIAVQLHLAPDLQSAAADVQLQMISAPQTANGFAQSLADECAALLNRLSAQGCDVLGLGRQAVCRAEDMNAWHEMEWPARLREISWSVAVSASEPAT